MILEWSHLTKGDFEKALKVKDDAIRMMSKQFNPRTHVFALTAASLAYVSLGRWAVAFEEAQEALRIAEESSDISLIAYANMLFSIIHTSQGNQDKAIQYAELAVEKAPTPADEAWAQLMLGVALCRAGEVDKGSDLVKPVVSLYRAEPITHSLLDSTGYLTEGYLLAGEYNKAKQTAEELRDISLRCGAKWYLGYGHRLMGVIALKTDSSQATTHFEKAISIFQEIKAEPQLALAYSGMGRFHKQQGKTEEARKYLIKALEIFERLGTLIEPDKVRKELAELPQ
jgi:tetratricopeptide (TPR) repeat protein